MLSHVTLILPVAYRGGSLRVTKTIARMIRKGSIEAGEKCEVRIAVLSGKYDIQSDFSDIEDDINVVEFDWINISAENVRIINANQNIDTGVPFDTYQMPEDGINNFMDSDLWLLVSDRTVRPIAPIKPYIVFATDYIQRYVPEIFENNSDGSFDLPFLRSVREANGVIATTPQTLEDLISYVGVPRTKTRLAPMDFDPTSFHIPADEEVIPNEDYFVWPTNTTKHKNHLRSFQALQEYYDALGGKFRVKIMGPFSAFMDPKNDSTPEWFANIPYIKDIHNLISSSPSSYEYFEFIGEVSDAAYARNVAGAKFLWHPTLYDNGTFAIAEAAYLGTPSLSSSYPQMRYIGDRFSIPMKFFNARIPKEMAKSLKEMELDGVELTKKLPDKPSLEQHSWETYAGEYWQMLKGVAV